jgi:hypothetical protein
MAGAKKRFLRLEAAQRETNATLLRIEGTLAMSSRVFELMHTRLEHLEDSQRLLVEGQHVVVDRLERLEDGQLKLVEGQLTLVEGQLALVEGQKVIVDRLGRLENGQTAVVERLDRLVAATTRERTDRAEQLGVIETRLDDVERRLDDLEDD